MARAVRFDRYGPVEVLEVVDVDRPEPGSGEVLVEVVATAVNPGEIMIREGRVHEQWPATFPSGQGSDLAGRVAALGADVTGWTVGDEVLGWTDARAAQAEYVTVPAGQLVGKPAGVAWEQAASLYVAGSTAWGMVQVAAPRPDETVVVTAAAGGVGGIATQLLVRAGARVLGVAGPDNAGWLAAVGAEAVPYGPGLADRLRATARYGIDAALDTYGDGYVDLAVGLGVPPERIVTAIDFAAAERVGARSVWGALVASSEVLGRLAALIEQGQLTIPIAATYPLDRVREAYTRLAERRTRGKIVLRVGGDGGTGGSGT